MDYATYSELAYQSRRGALHFDMDSRDLDWQAIVEGRLVSDKPIELRRDTGSRAYDVHGTTMGFVKVVSGRVITVFRDGGFRGWSTFPVRTFGKDGTELPDYHGLAVTGRCGPIQWEKGRHVKLPPRYAGGPEVDAWIGMYFDPATWDGSDIFMPQKTSSIIISDAVRMALERAKVTNAEYQRLTEVERTWRV